MCVQNKLFEKKKKIEKRTTETVQTFFLLMTIKQRKFEHLNTHIWKYARTVLIHPLTHTNKQREKKKKTENFLRIGLKLKEIKIVAQTHR